MKPKGRGSRLKRLLAFAGVVALVAAALLAPGPVLGVPGTTERVSVDSAGGEGNGPQGSFSPDISADGRFVAFESFHINLVPGDTNNTRDVFVHDRQTGTTERVSVDSFGNQGNFESRQPAISADGRFVVFESVASNLVPGDTNNQFDVFVHDRQTATTERVSVDSAGNQANRESQSAAISADGRFVCFSSGASNLVPGDTNNTVDTFVRDRQTATMERVSVDSSGNQGNSFSNCQDISADGRFVVFLSGASNLVAGDTNGFQDVFVHDRQTGTTERVSIASDGSQANGHSFSGAVSADGRFVVFESVASNLVPGDTNNQSDIFVHDRQTGTTERVSVASDGTQANSFSQSFGRPISADGRFVAFSSGASNLVAGDTNGFLDVFVHDRQTGTTERVSVASDGSQANSHSFGQSISAEGRFIAFSSVANNLVPGDTNGLGPAGFDIFVHDRGPVGLAVPIDIKPGSFPNSINPRSKGVMPVAILTTDTFDATTVDPATVRFGRNGTEAAPVHSALEDVDGDGDTDMILQFNTQATGIQCGDTSASLTGETFSGQTIQGSNSVRTVGCK